MQNSEEIKKEEKKDAAGGLFGRFGAAIKSKLAEKDEREVRRRLSAFTELLLMVAATYLAGGAELFFGTFPIVIALVCSTKKKLAAVSLGLLLLIISGGLPYTYAYACIATLLIRVLAVVIPAIFAHTETDKSYETGLVPVGDRELVKKDMPSDTIEGGEVVFVAETKAEKDVPPSFAESEPAAREEKNILFDCLEKMFCEELYLKMFCAAAGGFICGLFLLLKYDFSFYSLCGTLTLIFLTPLAVGVLCGYFGEERYKKNAYLMISFLALAALCVLGARERSVLGMPMSPFIAMLLTLWVSSGRGVIWGSVTALACGLVLDLKYAPLLLLSALLFCLVSAVRRNAGLAAVCAAVVVWCYYIGGEVGLVGVLPPMLLAIPCYMVADKYREMMTSPYKRAAEIADGVYFAEAVTEKTKNEAVKDRLVSLSEAFSSLSETFYKLSDRFRRPDVLGIKRITEDTFERTCRECRNREICYGAEYSDTLEAMGSVTSRLHIKGNVSKEVFSEKFNSRCIRQSELVDALNSDIAQSTEKIINGGKISFFASNYDEITAILGDALEGEGEEYECDTEAAGRVFDYLYSEGFGAGGVVVYGKRCKRVVAKEICVPESISAERLSEIGERISELVGVPLSEPALEVGKRGKILTQSSKPSVKVTCAHGRISHTGREWSSDDGYDTLLVSPFPENDDEMCGDMTDAFITDNSYFYSLISDGMGSGAQAAFVSGVCAMFIEKMLSAGNRADITLRMLNNVIRSENMGCGDECSSTVDLMELDLMSGTASFIKSGAAPTYIARGDTVYKINSRTMPVGIIKDADARITKFDTKAGDLIIMISDGCCPDSSDCPWLVDYLCSYISRKKKTVEIYGDICESLKDEILREAVKNFPEGRERDDISVSVVLVE